MEIVARRDATTLCPIIDGHLHPNTGVWSDEWWAYSNVANLTNVSIHKTVIHSVNFIDRVTGVHTNHIESYWNRVKKFKRMKGVSKDLLDSYLDEFMWRERYGDAKRKAYYCLCRDISLWFPV